MGLKEDGGRDRTKIVNIQDLVPDLARDISNAGAFHRSRQIENDGDDELNSVREYEFTHQVAAEEVPCRALPAWAAVLSTHPILSVRDAACVLAGVDPMLHGKYTDEEELSIRRWRRALNAANDAGMLVEFDEGMIWRIDLDEWCFQNEIPLPLKPLSAATKERLSDRRKCLPHSGQIDNTDDHKLAELQAENNELKKRLADAHEKIKSLATGDSGSVVQMMYAMAVSKPYNYKHGEKRNEATALISAATYASGLGVTDETVLRHLRGAHLRLFGNK